MSARMPHFCPCALLRGRGIVVSWGHDMKTIASRENTYFTRTITLAAVAVVSFPTAAYAQYDFGPPMDYHAMNMEFTQSWTSGGTYDEAFSPSAHQTDWFVTPDLGADLDTEQFSFDPDPAVRAAVSERFAWHVEAEDVQNARWLREGKAFRVVEKALKPHGLTTDNLADTVTASFGTIYDAANGISSDIGPEGIAALHDQIVWALSQTGNAATMSAARRQELSDSLVTLAVLVGSSGEACAGGTGASLDCSAIAEGARQLGREIYGLDLTDMVIDERGLRPRDGGASGEARAKPTLATTSTARGGDEVGACGFPVREAAHAAGQDVLARMNMCDEYEGPRR